MRARQHREAAQSGDTRLSDEAKPRSGTLRMSTFITLLGASVLLLLLAKASTPSIHVLTGQLPRPVGAVSALTLAATTTAHTTPMPAAAFTATEAPRTADPPIAVATAAPAATTTARPARVALIMLVVGSRFPSWWPFLVASYERNAPTYTLIVVHTSALSAEDSGLPSKGRNVRYEYVPLSALQARFVQKLGATPARVEAKFASAKGLSDLKPFYGHVFEELLDERTYTHWGWADWDLLLGDLSAVVPERSLWEYDALTFPGATLGFAWAGQLSILRNDAPGRALYTVVPNHLELGFKTGAGEQRQSGWEERVLLRETLRHRPSYAILFHMAAQFDYKAQWLTWVPFDHFWHEGKVWRCAKQPLTRPGRPPLLVQNATRWLADVRQVIEDPHGFERRTDGRVCIRWDLESSPWRCCPQGTGVHYAWKDGKLTPILTGFINASASVRAALAAAARLANVVTRERSYDVCHEGAFFHAGLTPKGSRLAPSCAHGTWALQDDIGRFSGALALLQEDCSAMAASKRPREDSSDVRLVT